MIAFIKTFQSNKRGQAIVELTLILPMILTLTLGAVELSNMIYAYQVMHHLTAQGANMAARISEQPPSNPPLTFQEQVNNLMNKVIDASCPTIRRTSATLPNCSSPNESKWTVIYTQIGPDTSQPDPKPYVIVCQIVKGTAQVTDSKRVCTSCGLGDINPTCNTSTPSSIAANNVPNIATINSGQTFHSFEVFYDYSPITVLGNFAGATFAGKLYERSIF